MKNKGFTLIELLVVIAIIGILAGILFIAIDPKKQTTKAKATKIASDLKLIEKAFQLTAMDDLDDYELYPIDPISGGARISQMVHVDNGHLKYVSEDISPNIGNSYYSYDNDNDPYMHLNSCPGGHSYAGVNIYIQGVNISSNAELMNALDKIIDQGDGLGCGKFRNATGAAYSLDDNR